MLSTSDSASARMRGLSRLAGRFRRGVRSGQGRRMAIQRATLPEAWRRRAPQKRRPLCRQSGPSLGRKRPRRAYAVETTAPTQPNCAPQHCQGGVQRNNYVVQINLRYSSHANECRRGKPGFASRRGPKRKGGRHVATAAPSLGRKRPRRAYAIDHIAPQQDTCASQPMSSREWDNFDRLVRFSGFCGSGAIRDAHRPPKKKRRPPCRHSGPEFREETPKEGMRNVKRHAIRKLGVHRNKCKSVFQLLCLIREDA